MTNLGCPSVIGNPEIGSEKRRMRELCAQYFLQHWSGKRLNSVLSSLLEDPDKPEEDMTEDQKLLWVDFGARGHHGQVMSHKHFIMKCYDRIAPFGIFPNLKREKMKAHDLSKLDPVEVLGYTEQWVRGTKDSAVWKKGDSLGNSLTLTILGTYSYYKDLAECFFQHLTITCNTTVTTQSSTTHMMARLEPGLWGTCPLTVKNLGKCHPGTGVSTIVWSNFLDLEESIVDMLACQWERPLGGCDDVKLVELAHIKPWFLNRYTMADQGRVKSYLHNISLIDDSKNSWQRHQ